MIIHVVKPGDTIQTIADYYGITADKIIADNGYKNPKDLIIGQSFVIVIPERIYTVKEGDTLESIATDYNLSTIELLANNPYLSDRNDIYPGDTIVISYNKKDTITTHGNTIPTINIETLKKTLPYLTYLSIVNYTATNEGEIISYYDDAEVIQLSKTYGVAPLMLLTTLTIQGVANIQTDLDLLMNIEFQHKQIENILSILKSKGYLGLNLTLHYVNLSNIELYESYLTIVTNKLNEAGYPVFVTINPNITDVNNELNFPKMDYSLINRLAQNIIFMSYEWPINITPPSPINSIYKTEVFLNYILNFIPAEKIIISIVTIGYDWELPYVPGISKVNYVSYDNVVDLAYNYGVTVDIDSKSLTPYFTYTTTENINHIVWFINSQTISGILDLITKYNLKGLSIWSIAVFNPQLWLIVNSNYNIAKISF